MDEQADTSKMLSEAALILRRLLDRQKRSTREMDQNAFLRASAVERGSLARDVEYWIVGSPMGNNWLVGSPLGNIAGSFEELDLPEWLRPNLLASAGALNGYVAFPKRRAPLRVRSLVEPGIHAYIPVHGGVSYIRKDQTACVYGFDTNHPASVHVPRTERPWIHWQCQVLYEGILQARKIEPAYRRAQTNDRRAELLRPLVELVPEETLSTPAMLNILMDRL